MSQTETTNCIAALNYVAGENKVWEGVPPDAWLHEYGYFKVAERKMRALGCQAAFRVEDGEVVVNCQSSCVTPALADVALSTQK